MAWWAAPDKIVKEGEGLVPEEWKSSKRVSDGHRLQLRTYFWVLVEENYGVRAPHGAVVLGDGSRIVVKNTEALRESSRHGRRHQWHMRSIREEILYGNQGETAECKAASRWQLV